MTPPAVAVLLVEPIDVGDEACGERDTSGWIQGLACPQRASGLLTVDRFGRELGEGGDILQVGSIRAREDRH